MHANYEALAAQAANFVALSPISFLRRAAVVYGDMPASSYADRTVTWREFADRCRALAAGLKAAGVGQGDTVSVIMPNIPAVFELHFAVPLAGAVLNTINTRVELETLAYILDHSDCKLVICDAAYSPKVRDAVRAVARPIDVFEIEDRHSTHHALGLGKSYDQLFEFGSLDWTLPGNEWQAIALNYTSGTSGRPKGVVYHHRGAWMMAMGTVAGWSLPQRPTYLSIVPAFHCNGWSHLWALAIVGGHAVFTRDLQAAKLFAAISRHGVTHFGAAPIVLQMLCESDDAPAEAFDPGIAVMTAGAPPPPSVLERAAKLGLEVMHVYGLTETYGHISQCLWKDEWAQLTSSEKSAKQAMQGVPFPIVEGIRVVDRASGQDVPRDGVSQGEIAIRGNTVMKGYYKDPDATAASFQGGWFWSGDAAVVHPDGYMQIRDRIKDVIISGGENISSIEVETAIYRHPAVMAAAVVARAHDRWGETPCAFIELRDGQVVSESDIIAFCETQLAGFKVPKTVIFQTLPKTSTGKIQKYLLREVAKSLGSQS
jgi:fatty-acyl-CoA synthase